MSNERSTNEIDVYVGRQLKARRETLGLSQEKLADFAGISFQQIQKYERGLNRMGASRIFSIARILGVQVGYFFADLEDLSDSENVKSVATLLNQHNARELLTNYMNAGEPIQKQIFELVRILSPQPASIPNS